jgi:tryptophan-rich sensory protein
MKSPEPRSAPLNGLPAAAAFVAVSLMVGAIGGFATAASVATWYASLRKPPFNPPNAIFAPVWTTLYVVMALAAWRVWRRTGYRGKGRAPLTLYAVQLALNLAWSLIFFGMRAPGPALLEIIVLLAAIVATALAFWRVDRIAGFMFAPYLLWVSFATLLNFEVWRLN